MPASAVVVRSPGSCSMIRHMRLRPSTRPRRSGGVPMPSLVPPPEGVTAIPASPASPRIATTSSFEPGKTTASGVRPSRTYGEQLHPGEHVRGAGNAAKLLERK